MAMRQRCDLHATCNGTCNGRKALQVAAQTVRQPFRYRCARVVPQAAIMSARLALKQRPLLALRRGCKRTWYALSRYAAKYARNQCPGRQQSQVATPSHRLCSAQADASASRAPRRARWAGWPAANPPRTVPEPFRYPFAKLFRKPLPKPLRHRAPTLLVPCLAPAANGSVTLR